MKLKSITLLGFCLFLFNFANSQETNKKNSGKLGITFSSFGEKCMLFVLNN